MRIFGAVLDFDTEELRRFYESVDTDSEILASDIDVTGIEEREHAFFLKSFEVFVVSKLHFVHQIHDILYICLIRDIIPYGVLDSSVEINSEHRLRAGRNTSRTERITEAVVRNRIAKAAARGERIGIIRDIGKEGVAFRVHLRCKIAILFVLDISVLSEKRHGFNRESKDATCAFFIEPIHEPFLEPVEAVPVRRFSVREAEILKQALEIVAVVVTDVPKNGLEIASTGRLVQAINDLLETIGNDFVNRAMFLTHVHNFVRTFVVVLSILLLDKIVHIHKELGRSARA